MNHVWFMDNVSWIYWSVSCDLLIGWTIKFATKLAISLCPIVANMTGLIGKIAPTAHCSYCAQGSSVELRPGLIGRSAPRAHPPRAHRLNCAQGSSADLRLGASAELRPGASGRIRPPNIHESLVYGHRSNPLRTKPPALCLPTPDITPCGHNTQNGHVGHNPLNFSGCFERYCFIFASVRIWITYKLTFWWNSVGSSPRNSDSVMLSPCKQLCLIDAKVSMTGPNPSHQHSMISDTAYDGSKETIWHWFIVNQKIFIYNLHLLLLFSYIPIFMALCPQGVLSAGGFVIDS